MGMVLPKDPKKVPYPVKRFSNFMLSQHTSRRLVRSTNSIAADAKDDS